MIRIQPFEKRDWAATWRIIEPVFRTGETYAFSPDITEEEAHKVWIEMPSATFVAVDENSIIKYNCKCTRKNNLLHIFSGALHITPIKSMIYRDNILSNDRSFIEIIGYKMCSCSYDLHPSLISLFVWICTDKSRQEGVVDVDDFPSIVIDK